MNDEMPIFRVEISGWDDSEQFFVERGALQWGQGEKRRVLIRRRVRPGALVFIRLLQDSAASRTFPVAYRARQIRECDGGSSFELTLSQVWPTDRNASPGGASLFDKVPGGATKMN